MVFKKTARRFRPRRSNRSNRKFTRKSAKRGRFSRNKPSTAKMHGLMPDRTFNKFKYVTLTSGINYQPAMVPTYINDYGMLAINATTSVGSLQQYVFSTNYNQPANNFNLLPGNALWMTPDGDPLYPDSYGQNTVTGIDQWSSFYKNYLCHGSAIEVTCTTGSSTPGQLVILPVTCGIDYSSNDQDIATLLNFSALPDEQQYAKIKYVSSTGGMDRVKIKHKMLTKKLFDVKNLRDDAENKANTNTGSGVPNNPTVNNWVWYVAFIPTQALGPYSDTIPPVDGVTACDVEIKITYFCELMDRIELINPSNATVS